MIGEDRLQLNERFIKVFHLLVERGDIRLNDRGGKGIGDFAEKILGNRGYGHIVRAFLNPKDKRVIDYKHARTLCREYGVNENYMIDGIGLPFGFDLPEDRTTPAIKTKLKKGNILYTTAEAFAGSGVDTQAANAVTEDSEIFSIPGVSGHGLVAFPVEGRSMEPMITDGDIVVCRQIERLADIKENEIYAVKHNGTLWIKHVQSLKDTKGFVRRLKLISSNHLEFDPFEIDVNEYLRLFKVIKRISSL